ncbi:DUF4097 family beta strand repeat-containing protein [Actinokineospora spheciospongiae]|uniref:DUF4097 family beta strand repeat-containing protein n=1 Tax=Actinokineospora spheciospongiae TaxID=909613 RepID=UPI000D71D628|nr:DUF4097 family beta strand repeat-containing protein [Actinokineospora spheciospongiae]PWW62506.1 hypothetical protein DFQ13_105321 [Actinokineospora spheciospongiae]
MSTRNETFTADGPVHVNVGTAAGRIEVRLTDGPDVHVEVRHAPESATPWSEGVSQVLGWINGQLGEQGPTDTGAEAVRRTWVDFTAGTLTVRSPKAAPLGAVPLGVTVLAPLGSRVTANGGAASVTVAGTADRVEVGTGAGSVNVERATGVVQANAGTGTVRVGSAGGGLRARTGAGDVEAGELGGPSTIVTGRGNVHLATVAADLRVRSGSGTITVADATAGRIELNTGSGALNVAVRRGTPAEVDVSTGVGTAVADLPLDTTAPAEAPALRVRGRSGTGDVAVTLAG